MDMCYERVGDCVTVTANGTPQEIAGLVAALQDRQEGVKYALVREPYQPCYSLVKTESKHKAVVPCDNWSETPIEIKDQGDRSWRRFDLYFKAGPERDELYQLLDRLHLSRRELALIVLGLRARPEFSLADFDT